MINRCTFVVTITASSNLIYLLKLRLCCIESPTGALFVFYFSAHSIVMHIGELGLVASDSVVGRERLSLVPFSSIRISMQEIKSVAKAVFFDSSYSGA